MDRIAVVVAVAVLMSPLPAAGQVTPPLLAPPVDAPIVARFDPPKTAWGPGHRGVDYRVPAGTAVRAAAAGTVRFAGSVAGVNAVTIDHGSGLETTYSRLAEIYVGSGERVDEGRWIGTTAVAHPNVEGLHFGVKVEGAYVDPEDYLGPVDVAGAIHLVPLASDERTAGCTNTRPLANLSRPPNDNIAVAIAGLASKTKDGVAAAILEGGPEFLGYPEGRAYDFSYRGARGGRLHEPYDRVDTYRDIRRSAGLLRALLVRIARRHPGKKVDLIAHSQGGIVARAFLELQARSYDSRLPVVEHLVTFATPHGGAPLVAGSDRLDDDTWTGGLLKDGISAWARRGGPVPDPHSPAVKQLAPDSSLLRGLAREDVLYGTRVLALGIAHDVLVPADRAVYPGKLSRTLPPSGVNGHDAIVRSSIARAMAHAFLRDADRPCPGAVDIWGRRLGEGIGWIEERLPEVYGQVEDRAGGAILRVGRKVARVAGRVAVKAARGAAAVAKAGGRVAVRGARVVARGGKAVVVMVRRGATTAGRWVGRLIRRADPRRW